MQREVNMKQLTVEQVCNIIKEAFQRQSDDHFNLADKRCASYQRTRNPQHFMDTARYHYFGNCLKGLSETVSPEWIIEQQSKNRELKRD